MKKTACTMIAVIALSFVAPPPAQAQLAEPPLLEPIPALLLSLPLPGIPSMLLGDVRNGLFAFIPCLFVWLIALAFPADFCLSALMLHALLGLGSGYLAFQLAGKQERQYEKEKRKLRREEREKQQRPESDLSPAY